MSIREELPRKTPPERLTATAEAIARIIGFVASVFTYNLYFTWLRDLLTRDFDPADPEQLRMYEHAMRIQISIGDINLVRSLSANAIVVWLATALTRSNHWLGRLLRRAGLHVRPLLEYKNQVDHEREHQDGHASDLEASSPPTTHHDPTLAIRATAAARSPR